MPMDHNQGRRGHFHRGRRGPDRRGPDRRGPERPQGPPPEQPNRERTDRVDVEQIMREIRARIAQRSGVDLSNQQIQELAARRLEAILDPRGLKPELLEQLRKSAGERSTVEVPTHASAAQLYPFDEATLYDSPNAILRFFRTLLRPILRMLFNPTPIAHALALQSRLNTELTSSDAERDRRQAEWNALHYEVLRRLVTEVSRGSIETQSLLLRVESLAAKVDFNERRVRGMEGAQARPARPQETQPTAQAAAPAEAPVPAPAATEGQPGGDAPRRRRRRRRGRRGPGAGAVASSESAVNTSAPPTGDVEEGDADSDVDEGVEEEVTAAAPEPVPLDHRLPEATAHHEEPAALPHQEPVRDDTSHTPEE